MMPLRICLDEVDEITFIGRICNLVTEDILFYSFQDFIVKTDKFLDFCGQPQSSIEKRSMQVISDNTNHYRYNIPSIHSEEELSRKQGLVKTFDIQVRTRSAGDWQGEINCFDWGKSSFVNILDLMKQVTNKNT